MALILMVREEGWWGKHLGRRRAKRARKKEQRVSRQCRWQHPMVQETHRL
jgi:hypothetical protein